MVLRRSWRCRGDPTADWPNPRWYCGSFLNMFKVSPVPSRRSAVLTVFRGATAINNGTTAEPRRSWRCHCGLCRTSTAVVPRLRCDGGITETRNIERIETRIVYFKKKTGVLTMLVFFQSKWTHFHNMTWENMLAAALFISYLQ